jgi:anti-sigma regulatory factor (Ser/Thr protein kinase)
MVSDHLAATPSARAGAVLSVASELANNAVLHGRTPYVVALHVGEMLRIEVTDAGPGVPMIRAAPRDGPNGRGLLIVAELSTRWGVEWDGDGKVVWAELPLWDGAA